MELEQEKKQPTPLKGPEEYVLQYPVQFGEERITKITLKPLKGKHIKLLKKDSGMADMIVIASKSSGVSQAIFDEMDAKDVLNIVEIVGNFI